MLSSSFRLYAWSRPVVAKQQGRTLGCRLNALDRSFTTSVASRVRVAAANGENESQRPAFDDPHVRSLANEQVDVTGSRKEWDSRDSMEDTLGRDARDMLEAFVGDSNTGKESVGGETEEQDVDDIEQQYYLNDKLHVSEAGAKTAEDLIPSSSDVVQEKLQDAPENVEPDESEASSESKEENIHSSSGRDWRLRADGGAQNVTRPGVQPGPKTDEGTQYKEKQGSESNCDKGSELANPNELEDCSANADKLGCLEDLVMKKDNGKSPEDYNRRADIFGKSAEVFKAKKEEAECNT